MLIADSPAPEAVPRPALAAVAAGMRAMGLASAAFLIPLATGPTAWFTQRALGRVDAASVSLVVMQFALILGLWLAPRCRALLCLEGVALLATTIWWLPHRLDLTIMSWWAPGFWFVPWVCWATTLLTRRCFAILATVILTVLTGLDLLALATDDQPVTAVKLAPTPWITAPVLMMALFGYGLQALADKADGQLAQRLAAERARDHERAQTGARREAARLLHDHVLHALHAVSHVGQGDVTVEMARAECRGAVDAVADTHSEPMGQLAELIALDPVTATSGAVVRGTPSPLPLKVARAFAAATHEALGNVVRHAQARNVLVTMRDQGQRWYVTIQDDGVGFDPKAVAESPRLGLRRSVHERMADSGGLASVSSAPGQGTTVRLEWPANDSSETAIVWPSMGGHELARRLSRTFWPPLAVTPFMMVLAAGQVSPAWPLQVLAGVFLLVGVACIIRLQRRPLGVISQTAILVSTTLAWWLNLYLAPDNPPTVYSLWIGWTGASLVHLVILQVRFIPGTAVLLGWGATQLTALAVAMGPDELMRLEPSLVTGLAEAAVALLALRVARSVVDQDAAQAQLTEAMRRATTRLANDAQVEEFWSRRVTDVALPLLVDVADGRVALDEEVRSRAHRLEATLRDELVMGPDHGALLEALAEMRQRGWVIRTTVAPQSSPGALRSFVRHLSDLGQPSHAGQVMTISTSGAHAVAVVLDATNEQVTRWRCLVLDHGGLCEVDPDFVRLKLPLDNRATGENHP